MMNEVAVLPAPSVDLEVTTALAERTETRILSPARTAGYELRLVGATVLPQGQVICRTPQGAWLFADHADDPTAAPYGGKIPIPVAEHARLVALAEAGVAPDLVWLAHELPPAWQEGDRADRLVPAPAHLRLQDERLLRGLNAVRTMVLNVAGVTVSAVGTAMSAGIGALEGLDPIVLGGVRDTDQPIVAWVVLAQWRWS